MIRTSLIILVCVFFSAGSHAALGEVEPWAVDAASFPSFASCVTSPTTAGKTVVVSRQLAVDSDLAVPADRDIRIVAGGRLKVAAGKTVTISGGFEAGMRTHAFAGSGTVRFARGSVEKVYPQWWGAKGDYDQVAGAGADDTAALLAAIAAHNRVYLPSGVYSFSKTLKLPVFSTLEGESPSRSVLVPSRQGGTWTNGYAVTYNSEDGLTWVTPYPEAGASIRNLQISGVVSVGGYNENVKGVFTAGGISLVEVNINHLRGGIYTTNDYDDMVTLDKCIIRDMHGRTGDYHLYFGQLGDAFSMRNCHIYGGTGDGVSLNGILGGSITDSIIFTPVSITSASNLTVSGLHSESGNTITIDGSNVTLTNCYITRTDRVPLVIRNSYDSSVTTTLRDVHFVYYPGRVPASDVADIDYTNSNLYLENVYRRRAVSGNVSSSELYGVLVSYGGKLLPEFNKYSHLYSHRSALGYRPGGTVISGDAEMRLASPGGSWYPLGGLQAGGDVWLKPGDKKTTYFYLMAIVLDPVRLIGKLADAEGVVDVSTGGPGVLIPGTGANFIENHVVYRLYRGLSPGSYREYVDVPVIASKFLRDNGKDINGFVWKSREPGPADTFFPARGMRLSAAGGVQVFGKGVPVSGRWAVGDEILTIAPSGGEPVGSVCVAEGYPGVWKAFGVVQH